jgi:hypothetical protein
MRASTHHLASETDCLIERTVHRIQQYHRHIRSLENDGRESEGAVLVLGRLQRVMTRLQLYRSVMECDADTPDSAEARKSYVPYRRGNASIERRSTIVSRIQ